MVMSIENASSSNKVTEEDVLESSQRSDGNSSVSNGCLKVQSQQRSIELSYDRNKSSRKSRRCRTLLWDSVQIHSHAVQLGDNPSVSSGPPVAIQWESFETTSNLSLDKYEALKPKPRIKSEMLLPKHVREERLMTEAGVSRRDIDSAVEEAQKIRKQRIKSANAALRGISWGNFLRRREKSS